MSIITNSKPTKARESLIEIAARSFLPNVPQWANSVLSDRADPVIQFAEMRLLSDLFKQRELSGPSTTKEDLRSADLGLLLKYLHGRSMTGAMLQRLATITGAQNKPQITDTSGTVNEHPWVVTYRKHVEATVKRKKTVREQLYIVRDYVGWLRALHPDEDLSRSLRSVTETDVMGYISMLKRNARSGAMSVNSAHQTSKIVRKFMLFCSSRYGTPNQARHVKPISPPGRLDLWIPSEKQIEKLFEVILSYSPSPSRDFVLYGVMYLLGLRPFEARGLTWDGVDLSSNTLTFKGKNDKTAEMPLVRALVRGLKEYAGLVKPTAELVFVRHGKAISEHYVNAAFNAYVWIAGWNSKAWPRTLRHAFCTHLLEQTGDYLLVNQLARHENLETTEYYVHLTQSHLYDASGRIHDALHI